MTNRPARTSGVEETKGKGGSVPSARRSANTTTSTLEAPAGLIEENPIDQLLEHRRTYVKTSYSDYQTDLHRAFETCARGDLTGVHAPEPQGAPRAVVRQCQHSPDQTGGRRCIRCCSGKGLSYMWRNAAGTSPGSWRWLCADCEAVYRGLGLVGPPRTHVNAFTDGYGAGPKNQDHAAYVNRPAPGPTHWGPWTR